MNAAMCVLAVVACAAATPGSVRTLPGRDFEIDIPCSFDADSAATDLIQRFHANHFLATTIRFHVIKAWQAHCAALSSKALAARDAADLVPTVGLKLTLSDGPIEVKFRPLGRPGAAFVAVLPVDHNYTAALDALARDFAVHGADRASLARLLNENEEFARRRRFEKALPLADGSGGAMPYASQYGQDEWVVEEVYPLKRDGFYVDVGAVDGTLLSNSLVLERALGWRGICVEPSSAYETLAAERSCTAVRACLSDIDGAEVEFVEDNGDAALLGMATMLSGMVDTLGAHRDKVNGKVSLMHTRTLRSVLDATAAPLFIEFLSLDTEGSELRILRGAGLEKYTFGAIAVEHNDEVEKRAAIRALLRSHGYIRVRSVGADDFYRSERSWEH